MKPLAQWKVDYDAMVAAMDNARLLEEALENHRNLDGEGPDDGDGYRNRLTRAELTRRLPEIGFLPGPPIAQSPGPALPWEALKPDDQAIILRQYRDDPDWQSEATCRLAHWRYHWGSGKPSFWEPIRP